MCEAGFSMNFCDKIPVARNVIIMWSGNIVKILLVGCELCHKRSVLF